MFEIPVDVDDDDLTVLKSPTASTADLQWHLSFMIANARGKTEVNIRNLTAGERKLMEEAKDKEVDQWISILFSRLSEEPGYP